MALYFLGNECVSFVFLFSHQMNKIEQHLCQKKVDVEEIDNEIENYRLERMQNSSTEAVEVIEFCFIHAIFDENN